MPKEQWSPMAMLAPVPPTLVTCGSGENINIITIAWTGILSSKPPKTYISVRPDRFSYNMIKESGEFVINLPTAAMVKAVDFCGVRSGEKTNKFTATNLTASPAAIVSAPIIEECPINIECRVSEIIDLGSHHMFMADIVRVQVNSDMIDPDGKLLIDKCGLLAYAHGTYFALHNKELGTFGFSVRKKPRPVRKSEAIARRRKPNKK